jgi:hypothetical protein
MALTCFLFPVVGLTAYGAALGPTIRLMPPLLAGVGNEDREGPPSVGSSSQVAQQMRASTGSDGERACNSFASRYE